MNASTSILTPEYQRFFEQDAPRIDGWLHTAAYFLIAGFNAFQRQHSLSGDICEVGMFEGKTFLLLETILDKSEQMLGIDLVLRPALKENLTNKARKESKIVIMEKDSTSVSATELNAFTANRGFRIFHVDGYHSYEVALSDTKLAIETTANFGVIMIDDFFSATVPGVTQAVFHVFEHNLNGDFVPVAIGGNKLFLAGRYYAKNIVDFLFDTMPFPSHNGKDVDRLFGSRVAIYDLY